MDLLRLEDAKPARQEQDTSGNGKVDRWISHKNGAAPHPARRQERRRQGGFDALLRGQAARSPRGRQQLRRSDGRLDHATTDGRASVVEADKDFNENIDVRAEFDAAGNKIREQQDTTDDGKLDTAIFYENGKKVRLEEDTTANEKTDVITFFEKGKIAKKEADTTGDGHFDTVATYKKGIERRQAQDKDADGKPELVIYLNKKGDEDPRGTRHEGGGTI